MALAATRTPSDLRVIGNVSMQRVLAMLRGRASVSSQVSGPFPPCLTENGPVLRCFCAFACLQVMYLAPGHAKELPPGNDGGRNDGWLVRALTMSLSLKIEPRQAVQQRASFFSSAHPMSTRCNRNGGYGRRDK